MEDRIKKQETMTDREKIIAEIERLKNWEPINITQEQIRKLVQRARLGVLIGLEEFINSLPAEQPSDNLDNFISTLLEKYPINKVDLPIEALNDYHQGLICGASKTYNWILESAIKIDAKIVNDESSGCVVDCAQGCLVIEPHTYPIGQKLKILIVKEAEQ